ncbi:RagB/SusD family nutrient uptake outer membrane protein [Sphingobacterium faecale]|uniref:RagB/SusD family nutrient uptake outer membrane protein n=1 Tax=Sphingobacterium faecale TaxID=2803775 RepID=A0ABS1R783_9SPHI|nr:RagB/SusD family nutrient uptake outer membrane protein [Sphingobacterium faecale]MBL1410429.1 RagB/SusD family nutrient uptake outer membrane protein [Sphingobacterium faecale]
MVRILYILLLSCLCLGCNKWLEVQPKTHAPEDVLFKDEQGFKDALTGVYVSMSSPSLYAKEMTMGLMDVLAQNYNITTTTNTYYQASKYNYLDIGIRPKVDGLWKTSYNAIANINNLLANIDAKKSVFKKNNYEQVKGEALALRALLHFDLLRTFGPIPTASGMMERAIPYVTSFKMDVVPSITLAEGLDFCLKDLEDAIDLLAQNKAVNNGIEDPFLSYTRNHMNYWASTGLMARIYLYKGDKELAYKKAKEVVDSKLFNFVTANAINSSTRSDFVFSSEILFGLYVSNLKDINTSLFSSSASTSLLSNTETFRNQLYEIAVGGSTDFRYLYLWGTEGSSATKYPLKYWQSSNVGNNITNMNRVPCIRLTEMYYIAAEATSSLGEKIDLINTVRTNRGLKTLAKSLDGHIMTEEIFKEYKKEFYQEGQLFFYFKRKNADKIEGFPTIMDASVYVLPKPDDEIEFSSTK